MDSTTNVRPAASAAPAASFVARTAPSPALPEQSARKPLDPAVSVELSQEVSDSAPTSSELTKYVRDAQSQALVYRVTDMTSGEVIVQIPDAVVLKARVYAQQATATAGELIERRA